MTERILDAASGVFCARGIRATTMKEIAGGAGISREWLYKHFHNRDEVLVAVSDREVSRFLRRLGTRVAGSLSLTDAATDAFVFAVEFLRDHPLLSQIRTTEPDIVVGVVSAGKGSVFVNATEAVSAFLCELGGMESEHAVFVSDVMVRILFSIVFLPDPGSLLDENDYIRRYAGQLIPALMSVDRSAGT